MCGVPTRCRPPSCASLQCEEDGQVFFSLDDGATKFTDLIQLVEFYQLNKGVLPCKLKHPCTVVALWHRRIPPVIRYHLTWLCLKQTQEPFSRSVLFVFISLKSWWIDWLFCIVMNPLETADLLDSFYFFFFFCMDVQGVDAQLRSWGSRR